MKIDKDGFWKGRYLWFYFYIGLNGVMFAITIGQYCFDFDIMFTKIDLERDD